MKKHLGNGVIEVSGQDLADLQLVVDETLASDLAFAAARRVETMRLRKSGLTWGKARKAALSAQPTPEMLKVVREQLGRGSNNMEAINAAISASGLREIK